MPPVVFGSRGCIRRILRFRLRPKDLFVFERLRPECAIAAAKDAASTRPGTITARPRPVWVTGSSLSLLAYLREQVRSRNTSIDSCQISGHRLNPSEHGGAL